jgi:hypothetical protein
MAGYEMELQDLHDRYEGDLLTRYSVEYLSVKIDDAVALVQGECPSVPTRLASGALLPNNYKRIIADVILRVVRNPEGYSTEAEGGASYGHSAVVASGNLWLTQMDIDVLNGVPRAGRSSPQTVGVGTDGGWGN